MKIVPFKRFFQVQENGYTLAQFDTREEAESFKAMGGAFPASFADIKIRSYKRKVAYKKTRINIYP